MHRINDIKHSQRYSTAEFATFKTNSKNFKTINSLRPLIKTDDVMFFSTSLDVTWKVDGDTNHTNFGMVCNVFDLCFSWNNGINFFYRQDAAKRQIAGIKFTQRPKIRVFAPQGRLVAPIHVKFGRADGHVGPLGCAKFHLNRHRGGNAGPKYQNFHFLVKRRPAWRFPWPISKIFSGFIRLNFYTAFIRLLFAFIYQIETKASFHELSIPAGYCHAHMLLYVSGVNYNVNSKHTKYFAQLCGGIFTFWNISTTN